ncbi:MAG: HU family DNA-binding protein [Muribaculaceae bacterium]
MNTQSQRRYKTKRHIAQLLSQSTDLGYVKTEKVLNTLLGILSDVLACGEEISLHNFGAFRIVDIAERPGTNPGTGQPITIKAHRAIRFTPCQNLRNLVR